MKASIFPDNTDSNQDDDIGNDDSERNVSETNSTSHHEDEDKDAWLKFVEEKDEIDDWDLENSNQEEIFTQDTKYGSDDSLPVMNTQPSRSLRDLLNRVTSYEAPDPGGIRVTEITASNIESDDLVDPKQSLLLRLRMMNGTSTAKQLKIQHRSQRDAKQTKNSEVVFLIQVKFKI